MEKKWNNNYLKLGVTITLSLCVCIIFGEVIQGWRGILRYLSKIGSALTPFVIGIVIAYLLNPVMMGVRRIISYIGCKQWVKDKEQRKKNREKYDLIYRKAKVPSLAISLILFLLLIYGFLRLVIPQIYLSLNDLVVKTPGYVDGAEEWVRKVFAKNATIEGRITQALEYFQENVFEIFKTTVMPNIDTIVLKLSSGVMVGVKAVFNLFVGLIVAVYLLASKETLLAQTKKVIYCVCKRKTGNKILRGAAYANSVFGGFISGKIIDSVIIGFLCLVFTKAVGMEYAVLISVIVGVTNVIPFFGPFIGAVPGALLALMDDPIMMVVFIVWIIILQQFDGNILGPLILGDTTGLSSIWVLVAILVGGDLFGVPGMILGVPVFACIYAFVAVQLRDGLRKKKLSSDTSDYYHLTGFDEDTGEPMYRDKHEKRMTLRQKRKKELLFAHFKNTTDDGEIDHSFDRALERFEEEYPLEDDDGDYDLPETDGAQEDEERLSEKDGVQEDEEHLPATDGAQEDEEHLPETDDGQENEQADDK